MIYYECLDTEALIEVVESLAYRIIHNENPRWNMVKEEDVVQLLREEGLCCWTEE